MIFSRELFVVDSFLFDELQFICLIGERVCNPRQQHALNIYLKSLSDYKQHAAAAG